MFDNDQFNQTNQFVITYELLSLLLWIIEHEDETLVKIVKKAFASGLQDEMKREQPVNDEQLLEEAQQGIIDFFGMLESHMLEVMHERSVQRALEKNLLPAIDHIDTAICDDATVRMSVEKATSSIQDSNETAKEVLYKELLKRWKPGKNQSFN